MSGPPRNRKARERSLWERAQIRWELRKQDEEYMRCWPGRRPTVKTIMPCLPFKLAPNTVSWHMQEIRRERHCGTAVLTEGSDVLIARANRFKKI